MDAGALGDGYWGTERLGAGCEVTGYEGTGILGAELLRHYVLEYKVLGTGMQGYWVVGLDTGC